MLNIPERFQRGINNKISTIYPIVGIVKRPDFFSGSSPSSTNFDILLSQKKGEKIWNIDGYYEDRDLKVSSIKESIDITNKNFKTNQVTITLSNYIYQNERFTNEVNFDKLINAEVYIFYANSSCENLDDCVLAFKGFVKDYSGGKDKISIKVEDHSQKVFQDKNLPRYKTYDPASETIERSKNAFFPITYGHNENAPLIFTRSDDMNTESQIFPDSIFRSDIDIEGFVEGGAITEVADVDHCLSVFREDAYHKIPLHHRR